LRCGAHTAQIGHLAIVIAVKMQIVPTLSPSTAQARVLSDEKAAVWPTLTGYYKGWGDYQQLTERQLHVVELVPNP
jgi:hypothetical protein